MSRRHEKAHPCPTAAKTGWGTEEAAEEALAVILEQRDAWREKLPCRVYLCPCGKWHLTSVEHEAPALPTGLGTAAAAAIALVHAATVPRRCSPTAALCIGSERGGACSCGETPWAP